MKKIFLFLLLFLVFNLDAQFEKGDFLFGMSTTLSSVGTSPEMFGIGFSSSKTEVGEYMANESRNFGINLVPKTGYFLSDHFVLGADANLKYNLILVEDQENFNKVLGGLGFFGRVYKPLSKSFLFAEFSSGIGIAFSDERNGYTTKAESFVQDYGLGAGITVPISEKILLDFFTGYDYVIEIPNKTYNGDKIKYKTQSIGFEIGLVAVLNRKE